MAHQGNGTVGRRRGPGGCLIVLLVLVVLFVGGGAIGYAHGPDANTSRATTNAHPLPDGLCTDLGPMSALLPSDATHRFTTSDLGGSLTCDYTGPNSDGQTYVSLHITVWRSGTSFALDEYDHADGKVVAGRPYPTKLADDSNSVVDDCDLTLSARDNDLYLTVFYLGHPIDVAAARSAVLAISDRVVGSAG